MNATPKAKKLWEQIPMAMQTRLLNNVYCTNCKSMCSIEVDAMSVEKNNPVLRGKCIACAGPVARVIENE
jgi:hypothetical protein